MHKETKGLSLFVKSFGLVLGLCFLLFMSAGQFIRGPVQRDAFMGAEYCGSCHQQEYRWWLKNSHSRAHELINITKNNFQDTSNSQSQAACKKCHQTPVSKESPKFLHKISCESCHGPGKYYSPSHIKKDFVLSKMLFKRQAKESCIDCHNNKATDPIWLKQGLEKIHHGPKLPVAP